MDQSELEVRTSDRSDWSRKRTLFQFQPISSKRLPRAGKGCDKMFGGSCCTNFRGLYFTREFYSLKMILTVKQQFCKKIDVIFSFCSFLSTGEGPEKVSCSSYCGCRNSWRQRCAKLALQWEVRDRSLFIERGRGAGAIWNMACLIFADPPFSLSMTFQTCIN